MGFPLISQAEDIVGSVVADNYADYKVNVKTPEQVWFVKYL